MRACLVPGLHWSLWVLRSMCPKQIGGSALSAEVGQTNGTSLRGLPFSLSFHQALICSDPQLMLDTIALKLATFVGLTEARYEREALDGLPRAIRFLVCFWCAHLARIEARDRSVESTGYTEHMLRPQAGRRADPWPGRRGLAWR